VRGRAYGSRQPDAFGRRVQAARTIYSRGAAIGRLALHGARPSRKFVLARPRCWY